MPTSPIPFGIFSLQPPIIFILNPIQIPGNMCMCSSSHIFKIDKELKILLNDSN